MGINCVRGILRKGACHPQAKKEAKRCSEFVYVILHSCTSSHLFFSAGAVYSPKAHASMR
jgi:hypothetical protein